MSKNDLLSVVQIAYRSVKYSDRKGGGRTNEFLIFLKFYCEYLTRDKELKTRSHESGDVFKINLFRDIFRFDILVLISNENNVLGFFFPSVLLHPVFQGRVCKQVISCIFNGSIMIVKKIYIFTVNSTEQLSQQSFVYSLECNSYNVANELSDRILKTDDSIAKFWHGQNSVPKVLKVALFQYIAEVHDLVDWLFLHLRRMKRVCQ